MKKLLTIFTILILISFAPQKIFAWTNYVDAAGSDTAPYDTWAKAAHSIQDAANYAVEGNVVLVADGVYTPVGSQIIIVTNNIIVKSVNGAGSTAIDGNTTKHPIYLRGNSVIDGFFIRNGRFSNGGGIFVLNHGKIFNCSFTNNFALADGGAIKGDNILISNCYFKGNYAVRSGGAISLEKNSSIKNCVVEYNSAVNGGAVFSTDSASISDSSINNNIALNGGGISVTGGTLNIEKNCYIIDNLATNMGGGIYADNADVSITGTNTYLGIFHFFSGYNFCLNGDGGGMYAINSDIVLSGKQCYAGYNYSSRDGGAFYITNSSLSLLDNSEVFVGWTSRNGGGIYAMDSRITMDNALMSYCYATNGGGIFAVSSSGTFNNSSIEHNVAENIGGGFFNMLTGSYYFTDSNIYSNKANQGGGIFTYLNVGDFILDNTDVISNRADSLAAGIAWGSIATLEATNGSRINYNLSDENIGGLYLQLPGKFLFNDTEISYNSASNHAGGIAIANGQMECIDCEINNNVADANSNGIGVAGALWSYGTIDLISLNGTFTMTNNHAADGGAVYLLSGGKLSAYGDVLFADNRANQSGGAIYATNQSFASLMPTNDASPRFIDNIAIDSGGGVAIYGSSKLTAINTLFENNISSNVGGAIYLRNASTGNVYAAFSGSNSTPPCVFSGNSANHGGAINESDSCILNINDSLFVSNSAYHAIGKGGALYAGLSSIIDIQNSVIVRNSANGSGNGINISSSSFLQMKLCTVTDNGTDGVVGGTLAITNSIFWNNGAEITAGKTVDYCDVDGGYATGNGNFSLPPLFVAPASLDFRLTLGSPCIDTGTVVNVSYDCIGNPRPTGGGYDLGAYEFIPEPCCLLFIIYYLLFINYWRRLKFTAIIG